MEKSTMRKSINVAGFSHKNPIPAGSVIGNLLMTGVIFGVDPDTGKMADNLEDECRFIFENARRILAAAGGNFDDILKMTFYLKPDISRDLLNKFWVEIFPNPDSRPARHVILSQTLPADMHIQSDLVAVLGSSKDTND
jgi:enamine deaminase RidA (YjgF/YER057c/UK114 family)